MRDLDSALAVARMLDSIGNCVPLRNAWELLDPAVQTRLKDEWRSIVCMAAKPC